jgi:hypothetical protein
MVKGASMLLLAVLSGLAAMAAFGLLFLILLPAGGM